MAAREQVRNDSAIVFRKERGVESAITMHAESGQMVRSTPGYGEGEERPSEVFRSDKSLPSPPPPAELRYMVRKAKVGGFLNSHEVLYVDIEGLKQDQELTEAQATNVLLKYLIRAIGELQK